ncbi:MAG: Holliday junction resolvase RuvX [Bacteroidetes bacterium]|nr:Holliday junction resolvase RuvX [Bacteroidota bacterium]
MGRYLGIDYGKKRTGLAVSDPTKTIASPLTTVLTHELPSFIESYAGDENLEGFIIGYPRQMNNKPSEIVKYINPFIKYLKKKYSDIPVYPVDERFTSKIAMQAMVTGGMKKQKRRDKANVDKISAAIILQSFLDRKE